MTGWNDPERVLDQFRQWLADANREAEQADAAERATISSDPDSNMPDPMEQARREQVRVEMGLIEPGNVEPIAAAGTAVATNGETGLAAAALFDVVEAFTALRHELKLQTRSTRDLGEQSERLLAGLTEAVRRFDTVPADEKKAARRAAEPLAEGLAGLDEALERGMLALEHARRQALDHSFPDLQALLEQLYRQQPWWRRWLGRRFYLAIRAGWLEQLIQAQRPGWDSLRDGYRLIQNRLRRSMETCGLCRIPVVGRPVDPHCMTVMEVTDDPSLTPGTVAAELRPGYLWNGAVLRFAEVRAVRGADQVQE